MKGSDELSLTEFTRDDELSGDERIMVHLDSHEDAGPSERKGTCW